MLSVSTLHPEFEGSEELALIIYAKERGEGAPPPSLGLHTLL